jgi:hypothetical protein
MTTKWKLILCAVALLAAFLLGFIPQFRESRQRASELEAARQEVATLRIESETSRLRDLAALMYMEVNRKNFGLASNHAREFFEMAGSLAGRTGDPALQDKLRNLTALQDKVTAGLSSADAGVGALVQELLLRVQEARPQKQ